MRNFQTLTTTSAPRRGFTLIELLVVITIIAILAALLGPTLAAAKKRATLAVCLSNQKQLELGWQVYADDHHGYMVAGRCSDRTTWRIGCKSEGGGANAAITWNSLAQNAPPSYASATPGSSLYNDLIRWETEEGYREAALFSYAPNVDILHCPGDNRWEANIPAWDSYSVVQGLNGSLEKSTPRVVALTRQAQIAHPADRFVFVEEADSRGDNWNDWDFDIEGVPPYFINSRWVDSAAAFHIDSSTFSFADGHVEAHRWLFQDTLTFASSTDIKKAHDFGHPPAPPNNADVKYVAAHFPCKMNP
ncbi:MAG: type II secretion system protein [Verrucomicrobiota bacterium]|nr:type II secretion system protein [Verrucomicrobiota bacterium]